MSKATFVNPFAAPVSTPVPKPTEERYGIAASGPPVDPSEIETAQRAAEVVLMWGDDVLHVAHVSPPRDVFIGEGATDYLVGRELLGAERLPIVIEREGRLCCVIPEGATGDVTVGASTKSFAELEAEGKLAPYAERPGAHLYPLPDEASARVDHRGLAFLVRPTAAGRAIGTAPAIKARHTGWIGLSLAVHAAFLVMFYFMPPHSSALSLDNITADSRMAEYIETAIAQEEPPVEWANEQPEPSGGTGERAAEEEGAMGDPEEQPSRGRYGVEGDPNDPNPELAREHAREHMESVGAIGTLNAMLGSWQSPTSPYGADVAHGNDAMSAMGALMGNQIAGNFGAGGLGMLGTGRGGGGFGLGTVGLGGLHTLGHGAGCSAGQQCGDGYGPGGGYGSRVTSLGPPREHTPRVTLIDATTTPGLSQEAIRRVVRRHINEVRFCYEQGLQSNPSLEGRVTVRWIIDAGGRVQGSALSSSTLSNGAVESCIVGAVQRWSFPNPEGGGVVGVNYPFMLQSSH